MFNNAKSLQCTRASCLCRFELSASQPSGGTYTTPHPFDAEGIHVAWAASHKGSTASQSPWLLRNLSAKRSA